MPVFELLLYSLLIVFFIYMFSRLIINKKYVFVYGFLLLIVFVLHLIFESYRWQLIFLYILLVFALFYVFKGLNDQSRKYKMKKVIKIILVLMFVFAGIVTYSFPVYQMPSVDGDYLIGSQSFVITDDERLEQYGDDDLSYRRFKIQTWYPAKTITGYDQTPWLEDGLPVSRALSKDTGLPGFVLDHTSQIMSHAYKDAPMSDDLSRYPIVIISHGWRGFKNLHTDFAEELASQGYFVVSIDHTYGSVATVFDDQDIAYLNLDALPSVDDEDEFLVYANQLVNTYAGDVNETIDYLEGLNSDVTSDFYGRLDMSKIGLLGHSTGGGGDVTVALKDARVDALIGLDAWVEPVDSNLMQTSLDIPSLFLRSGQWETGDNNINLNRLVNQSNDMSYLYQIDGTTHYDFTMVYMYSPLTSLIGFTGELEGDYLNGMLEALIVDFFDDTLKSGVNPSVDVAPYDEVEQVETD